MNRMLDIFFAALTLLLVVFLFIRPSNKVSEDILRIETAEKASIEITDAKNKLLDPKEIAFLFPRESTRPLKSPQVQTVSLPIPETPKELPALSHIGTIIRSEEEVFVFKDLKTGRIINLKSGESRSGYTLINVTSTKLTVQYADSIVIVERKNKR